MAEAEVLNRIAAEVNTVGKENGQFRQLAASQNASMSKFVKDISKMFQSQSVQQSHLATSMSNLEQNTLANSQKIDQTNALLSQSISVLTNLLNEERNIGKGIEQLNENQSSLPSILKNFALGAGGVATAAVGGAAIGGLIGQTIADNQNTTADPSMMNGGGGAGTGNDIGPIPQLSSLDNGQARKNAEAYFGRKMTDQEYDYLVRATHAEAAAGKNADPREQAMVMASILNRARDMGDNGVIKALMAKNQFQSVTGTKYDPGPSANFSQGPGQERQQSIENSSQLLQAIPQDQKNFTAASSAAYGPGTNPAYRDNMIKAGGTTIGGSVFNTNPNFNAIPSNQSSGKQDGQQQSQSGGGTAKVIESYGGHRPGRPDQKIINLAQQAASQAGMDSVILTSGKGDWISPGGRARGQKSTMHSTGLAVDIGADSFKSSEQKQKFIAAAKAGGAGGVGVYKDGSVHIDFGKERSWNWGDPDQAGFQNAVQSGKAAGGGASTPMGSEGNVSPSGGGQDGTVMPSGNDAGMGGMQLPFGMMGGDGSPLGILGSMLGSALSGLGGMAQGAGEAPELIKTAREEPAAVRRVETAALETDSLKFNAAQPPKQEQQAAMTNPSQASRSNEDLYRGGLPSQSAMSSSPAWYMQLAGRIHNDESMKFKGGVLA